jgi:hypothetical protein
MKNLVKWLVTIAAALFASAALAQSPRATFAQPELDQMLAPIALYPDSLLSQILMAATYPQDVAEAASWARAQGGLRGEQAVRAAEENPWDPSVVSLVAFPDVLTMMAERREWTARLGDAFLAQPDQVMDTVQQLRARADEAGNLQSSRELVVQRQGEDYVIEPPSPDYFYVPYYDPRVVYGDWWWSDWPPVYWNPWPGYAWRYGYAGFGWGPRVYLGSGFFFGAFDWGHRYVRYASHRPWYHHGNDYRGGYRWSHADGRGSRDGRGQGNWRGGRGQGQAQAARNPDGRGNNYRNGADRRSNTFAGDRAGAAPAIASRVTPGSAQQGFFRPDEARSATARPSSPRYGTAADVERGLSARSRTVPVERVVVPSQRIAGQPQRGSVERIPQQQHVPVERAQPQRAPVERVYTQRAAPVPQAPVERSAPVARSPVERAAPARERADAPDRGDSSPVSRGGGGGGGRGRDR